jgi:mannose-6-phosphate isomerase-like protein (cupin superfamily)
VHRNRRVGESPVRHDVAAGDLVHVDPGTALQAANHGDEHLVVYAYGYPRENDRAEVLNLAV